MISYFGTCQTQSNIPLKKVCVTDWQASTEPFYLTVYFTQINEASNSKIAIYTTAPNNWSDNQEGNNFVVSQKTIRQTFNTSVGTTELTSWSAGSFVTFIYKDNQYVITNWRPITNINNALSNYVSKSGLATDFYNNVIVNSSSTPSTTSIHDDILSFLTLNTETHGIYHKDFNTLIPYVHQEAKVGYNGEYKSVKTDIVDPMGTETDYNWFLVAETKIRKEDFGQGTDQDREIIFYVSDTQTGARRGILEARIRNYKVGQEPSLSLNWDYNKSFNLTDFVLVTNGNLDTYNGKDRTEADINITCQLYTRISVDWTARIFDVINQTTRTSGYNTKVWRLNNWFGGPSVPKSEQENYRFSSPEEGFKKTVLNNINVQGLKSIVSTELVLSKSNSNADLTQTNNGVSSDDWNNAILFKDKHDLAHYGRILAPIYNSGSIGLLFQAYNYAANSEITNANAGISTAAISLVATKNATSLINCDIENAYTSLYASSTDAKLQLFGKQKNIGIHLWADNNNVSAKYVNGAGLWYDYSNIALRRMIDYQPILNNNTLSYGKIFIGTDDVNENNIGYVSDYIYLISPALYRKTKDSAPITNYDTHGRANPTYVHYLYIGQKSDVYLGSNNFGDPHDLFYVGASINVQNSPASTLNGRPVILMVRDRGFYLSTTDGGAKHDQWEVLWNIEPDANGYLKLTKNNSHSYWSNNS